MGLTVGLAVGLAVGLNFDLLGGDEWMWGQVAAAEVWTKSGEVLGDRLASATLTLPSFLDWGICLVVLAVYAAIALPIGFKTGLLQQEWVTHPQTIVGTSLVALIFPSIFEEVVFRALLLPHPSEGASPGAIVFWSSVSLILFIAAHPLNALLVLTSRRDTFYDWAFLTLAGLLGAACTVTYLQSGSIWTAIGFHWLVVVVWLLTLGGDRRMGAQQKNNPS
ncbi:MAG: CPBP family glutamic-type intramembrane protease [Elainellaceae cyanobacterium]